MPPFRPFANTEGYFMGRHHRPLERLGWNIQDLFLLKQVHGDRVIHLRDPADFSKNRMQEGDAVINTVPQRPIAIKTADCVPILMAHPEGVVAGVHSGWRGAAKGILTKTLGLLREEYGMEPRSIKLAIGPAISQAHYEVGKEVAERFSIEQYPGVLKSKGEKFFLDLRRIHYFQALKGGVLEENLKVFGHCTFRDQDWYSYRRTLSEGKKKAKRNYSWIFFR